VFCVEPVFASVASYLVYGEILGPLQVIGAALILAAVAAAAFEG
jgi:drug/metabolite transporter (DMT)-like permease